MKSKMKIAIAFVAIALMLVVALVPMVSPISSDAAVGDVTVVPEATGSVTIKGTVKAAPSVNLANALVKVTASGVVEYALTDSNGSYSVTIYFTKAEKLTLTVSVDTEDAHYQAFTGETTPNPIKAYAGKFTTYTYADVTGGVFANTDFIAGYVKITGALYYKESTTAYGENVTVTANWGTTPSQATGSYSAETGQYSILVPVNTAGIVIKASGFDDSASFDVTTSDVSGKNLINTTTYLMTVTTSGPVTGHTFTTATVTDSKITTQPTVLSASGNTIKLTYVIGNTTGTNTNFVLKDDLYYFKDKTIAASATGTVAYDSIITGSLSMGTIPSYANTITAKFFTSDGTTEVQVASGYSISYYQNTYTIAFGNFNFTDYSTVAYIKIANTVNSVVKETSNISFTSSTTSISGQNISVDSTGYSLISGSVKMGTNTVPNVTLTNTGGGSTVGLIGNTTQTNTSGGFSFYAKDDTTVTLAATGSYDVASYSFTVSGAKTLNYSMKAAKYEQTVQVTDASGIKKLKDITVNYSIDYNTTSKTGTFSTVKTDKDGKFSVEVRSDVAKANVYIYFADTNGVYTFTVGTAATAIAMTNDTAANYKALQREYTFSIKDAAGTALSAADEGIGFTLAVYRVHAMTSPNEGLIYVQSSADVSSTISATATKGTYSFVGTTTYVGANPAAAGTYSNLYAIGFTYSDSCLYSFAKSLNTVTATGLQLSTVELAKELTVKEAKTTNTIKGISISVIDATTKKEVASPVTTTGNGKATVVLPSVTATGKYLYKVTDPNKCYTFGTDGTVDVYSGGMIGEIKANESTYSVASFVVKDSNDKAIKAADITVTAGKIVNNKFKQSGLPVDIKEDGSFKIVMSETSDKFVVVDNDGLYEFEDYYTINWTNVDPKVPSTTIAAKNAVLVIDVSYYDGLAAAPLPMIGVTVDIYKVVSGDQTKISSLTTDVLGMAYQMINGADTYVIKVTDDDGVFTFEDSAELTGVYQKSIKPNEGLYYQRLNFQATGVTLADVEFDPDMYYVTAYKLDGNTGEYIPYAESELIYKNAEFYAPFTVPYGAAFDYNDIYFSVGQVIAAVDYYPYSFENALGGDLIAVNGNAVNSVQNYSLYATLTVTGIGPVEGVTAVFFDQYNNILGTAISDENGKVIYDATACAEKVANKTVFSEVETAFGVVTFTSAGVAQQNLFLGRVIDAVGLGIDDVVISFTAINNATHVITEIGEVTTEGGYYYILSKYVGAAGYTTTFVAEADGYVTATNETGNFTLVAADVVFTATAYIDFMDGHVTVAGDFVDAEIGSKVTVVAEKSYFVSDDLQTMQYTFIGWYVDGKQVTTENVYCFELQDGMSVAPKYDAVPYEKPLPEPTPVDNSIDPTVLIIGICAVVIALIAVAYAVLASRQKKEQQ